MTKEKGNKIQIAEPFNEAITHRCKCWLLKKKENYIKKKKKYCLTPCRHSNFQEPLFFTFDSL
jgi:hypothetical protein